MKRPYPGMALVTTVFTTVFDNLVRRPIESLDLDEIQAKRGLAYPTRPPFSWVTGPVERSVGITFGTAPARDAWEVPLRIYRPRSLPDRVTDAPVILFLHGGGWVQGNVQMYDPLCTHLANAVRAVVVSVDYRKAPEHRAPTAVHDAVDAARWVAAKGAVLRADTSRMAVCGDSAGGNLAALVAQCFRDDGRPEIRHQALIYPATDLTKSSPSIRQHRHAPILTESNIDAFREHYLGPHGDPGHPSVSPLFGTLEDLPPALIQTADLDPLRDDGLRYAEALRAAGVPVRVTNYLRAPHGFASFPGVVPGARQARAELVQELRAHLSTGPPSPPAAGSAG